MNVNKDDPHSQLTVEIRVHIETCDTTLELCKYVGWIVIVDWPGRDSNSWIEAADDWVSISIDDDGDKISVELDEATADINVVLFSESNILAFTDCDKLEKNLVNDGVSGTIEDRFPFSITEVELSTAGGTDLTDVDVNRILLLPSILVLILLRLKTVEEISSVLLTGDVDGVINSEVFSWNLLPFSTGITGESKNTLELSIGTNRDESIVCTGTDSILDEMFIVLVGVIDELGDNAAEVVEFEAASTFLRFLRVFPIDIVELGLFVEEVLKNTLDVLINLLKSSEDDPGVVCVLLLNEAVKLDCFVGIEELFNDGVIIVLRFDDIT